MTSRNAHDRDRKFLASLATLSEAELLEKLRNAKLEWKRVAIARAYAKKKSTSPDEFSCADISDGA